MKHGNAEGTGWRPDPGPIGSGVPSRMEHHGIWTDADREKYKQQRAHSPRPVAKLDGRRNVAPKAPTAHAPKGHAPKTEHAPKGHAPAHEHKEGHEGHGDPLSKLGKIAGHVKEAAKGVAKATVAATGSEPATGAFKEHKHGLVHHYAGPSFGDHALGLQMVDKCEDGGHCHGK